MINNKNKAYLIALGKHLRELREEKDLSQEELANDSDIPINQIGRIERGEINTTVSTLYCISKALEVEPMKLLSFKFKA